MKRFSITNERTGLNFLIESASEELPQLQPEWGKAARTVPKESCDEWELTRATNERPDPVAPELIIVDLPADFVFTKTNIDAELADKVQKELQHSNLLERIKGIKKADLNTLDKCADAILDLSKAVRRLAKGD